MQRKVSNINRSQEYLMQNGLCCCFLHRLFIPDFLSIGKKFNLLENCIFQKKTTGKSLVLWGFRFLLLDLYKDYGSKWDLQKHGNQIKGIHNKFLRTGMTLGLLGIYTIFGHWMKASESQVICYSKYCAVAWSSNTKSSMCLLPVHPSLAHQHTLLNF